MKTACAFLVAAILPTAALPWHESTPAESPDVETPAVPEGEAPVIDIVTDPEMCPADLSFFGRTYIGYVDVNANWGGGCDVFFPKGHYEAYCSDTDEWEYSPGRSWNAEGDPNKTDREGLTCPAGYFAQLIIKGRESSGGSRKWIPYYFNYQDFYSSGEYCRFQCNDRPGSNYNDNRGKIRIYLYRA